MKFNDPIVQNKFMYGATLICLGTLYGFIF